MRRVLLLLALMLATVGFSSSTASAYSYTSCVRTLLGYSSDNDALSYSSLVYRQTGIWPNNVYPLASTRVWYGTRKMKVLWEFDNGGTPIAYATGRCVSATAGGPVTHDGIGWPPPTGWGS